MSQSSRKHRFDWGAVARQSAESAGFSELRPEAVGESFSRQGDVSPSLHVFFQRITFVETAPQALLGIRVADFENEWSDRRRRAGMSEFGEGPTFGLHVANVASLRPRPWVPFSPTEQDVAAAREWLGRVFGYATRLPSSMASLIAAIEADKIVDHSVGFYCGHPVKVRGFVQWLRRIHRVDVSAHVLPHLPDRTEPYDVKAMLEDD